VNAAPGPPGSPGGPGPLGELADRLWHAEAGRVPIGPLSDERPGLLPAEAYAIQARNIERRVAAGRAIRGHKVGLASRAVQELLGITEPISGTLLDDMIVEESDQIDCDQLIQPRAEAEIAFLMGADLSGPGVVTAQALAAIGGALAAIEVNDSRIADWRLKLADSVADNASSARLVLGGRVTGVAGLDLRLTGMLCYRNGVPIDSGAGAAALGHPARCVAWLANQLGTRGAGLRRGDIVLSGALHRMVPVRPGDVIRAEFAHLGAVSAYFSGQDSAGSTA
jgi:2-keto-4-pentenoate hydratase